MRLQRATGTYCASRRHKKAAQATAKFASNALRGSSVPGTSPTMAPPSQVAWANSFKTGVNYKVNFE